MKYFAKLSFKAQLVTLFCILMITYLFVNGVTIKLLFSTVENAKFTLMSIKSTEYLSTLQRSIKSLEVHKEKYKTKILEKKEISLDDLEIEMSTVNESLLGFVGETKQISFLEPIGH